MMPHTAASQTGASQPGPSKTKLQELIELAGETSSSRRRELLRELTDLFFIGGEGHGPREIALFDDVLTTLSSEMESEVQAELAERLADAEHAPRGLVRTLAASHIAVSEPLLARSKALSDEDLLQVVSTRGQEHLRAVSTRVGLSHAISDIIVERGDDQTLNVLLGNDQAELSRQASEKAVDRATANPALHAAMVGRKSLPVDLLNEMYFVVEARLRESITARNAAIDPAALEAALEAGRKRLATRDGALPEDFAEAETHVRALKRRDAITPSALVALLRHGERTKFLVALCELTEIDFHTARRIVERKDLDALAIVCKAANFDRALFLTFAVLILDPGKGMAKAEEYGRLYGDLPKESALRTMRFWKMRQSTGDVAAA
jgi:uncharacterized protein (DUF2336 family)